MGIITDSFMIHRGELWDRLMESLLSRLTGYLIPWAMMLSLYFNPFIAFGQPDPYAEKSCKYYIAMVGDLIGLGQWRIEKQFFQRILVEALHLSDSPDSPARTLVA